MYMVYAFSTPNSVRVPIALEGTGRLGGAQPDFRDRLDPEAVLARLRTLDVRQVA